MREKILSEFMEALQHCDTVKVVLTGVGESQFKTKDIYLGISKLEKENAKLPDLRREIAELKAINKDMYEALETIDETYKYRRIPDIRRKGHTILKDEIRGGAVFTYDDIKKVREALRKARGEKE